MWLGQRDQTNCSLLPRAVRHVSATVQCEQTLGQAQHPVSSLLLTALFRVLACRAVDKAYMLKACSPVPCAPGGCSGMFRRWNIGGGS